MSILTYGPQVMSFSFAGYLSDPWVRLTTTYLLGSEARNRTCIVQRLMKTREEPSSLPSYSPMFKRAHWEASLRILSVILPVQGIWSRSQELNLVPELMRLVS